MADTTAAMASPTNAENESFTFQAEINQLMSLIINTFYSKKDIFLRELISNASDAIDKARFKHLQNGEKYSHLSTTREIRLCAYPDKNMIAIEDDGIGMTKSELVSNLGTIANSGTKNFMSAMAEGNADISMIGQFGVGFYSAYLVAQNVIVYTHSMDEETTYKWESSAGGTFTIQPAEPLNVGTRLELYLKEDAKEYLTEDKLKQLVKTHSEYISYPIKLFTTRVEKKEVEKEEVEKDDEEGKIEEVTEKTPEYEEQTVEEWITLNTNKPIWMRKPEDITREEYDSFYKSISNDWNGPLMEKHFTAEGQIEFTCMLFIPKRPPFDMFKNGKKSSNVKLYVKRVFIMDNTDELIPDWLSFVHGIVDSEDIPLNVSREMLQQNRAVKSIRKTIVKRCVDMFEEIASNEDKSLYNELYKNFHQSIKLGIHEDPSVRERLINLLRYTSAKHEEPISLTDYVFESSGDTIYYITGSSRDNVKNSPFVEGVVANGNDVLFLIDPIDEYMIQNITTFEEKKLVNISKDNAKFCVKDEDMEKGLCAKIKTILNDKIEKVVVSNRLGKSPCCLVTSQYGWTANMERIMRAQTLASPTQFTMQAGSKKIMEINPKHPLISKLQESSDMTDEVVKNVVTLMYETALLSSGFVQDDVSSYVKRVYSMIGLGINAEEADTTESTEENSKKMDVAPEENMEVVD
jgi:molecular chaperone HtpG